MITSGVNQKSRSAANGFRINAMKNKSDGCSRTKCNGSVKICILCRWFNATVFSHFRRNLSPTPRRVPPGRVPPEGEGCRPKAKGTFYVSFRTECGRFLLESMSESIEPARGMSFLDLLETLRSRFHGVGTGDLVLLKGITRPYSVPTTQNLSRWRSSVWWKQRDCV